MKVLSVSTQAFFKRAIGVAEHYGFRSVDDFRIHEDKRSGRVLDLLRQQNMGEHIDHQVLPMVIAHYAAAVELKRKQSLMFYTPSLVTHRSAPATCVGAFTLNAVGVHDALAEIILVRAATSVLEELGIRNYLVKVNSIGDPDSSARFVREVSQTLRTRQSELPDDVTELLRKSPSAAIAQLYRVRHAITTELPLPIEFLTAPSRKHFKDILELLEFAGIQFELDDHLYGDHTLYSHTLFEIVERHDTPSTEEPHVLARGGRYDALTKAYARSVVPAAGIVIAAHTKDQGGDVGRPRRKKPFACLVHIGREARIRSISVVETFRKERIPIEQCLQFERFSEQMAYAEQQQAKYVIIMGQREALEGVAIVRNSFDRSQRTIPIDGLAHYFRATV